jgi:uncharacterized protein YqeY
MTFMDRLRADQEAARKSRDSAISSVLSAVLGECNSRAKSIHPVRALTDAEIHSVVQKTIKDTNEAITITDDPTERQRLERERDYLRRYLVPDVLSDDELEAIAIRLNPIMNSKQILDHLRLSYSGRYDPRRAAEIVRLVVNSP